MCAATIAFMDIKSASKAHLAEHKFDDRILTTEYYEPSTMQHGSAEGGSSLVFSSKMGSDGAANAAGDMKESTTHGRFASTSSSHGLVWNFSLFCECLIPTRVVTFPIFLWFYIDLRRIIKIEKKIYFFIFLSRQ
jgi:hypothetical protein